MISETFVKTLLAQDDAIGYLQKATMLSADGLTQLVAFSAERAGSEPDQMRQLLDIVISVEPHLSPPQTIPVADALYQTARIDAMQGDFAAAKQRIEQAKQHYLSLGRDGEAWRTTVGLMMALNETGQHATAVAAATEALSALIDLPESEATIAKLYQNRGTCYKELGQYALALADYAVAAQIFAAIDLTSSQAEVMESQGLLTLELGNSSDGVDLIEQAQQLYGDDSTPFERGRVIGNLGYAYAQTGRYSEALSAYETSYQIYVDGGYSVFAQIKLLFSAELHLNLNLIPEAVDRYEQITLDLPYYQARALWGWGVATGDDAKLAQAASIYATIGNRPMQAQVLLARATLSNDAGFAKAALTLAEDAPLQTLLARLWLANWAIDQGNLVDAEAYLAQTQSDVIPLRFRIAFVQGRLSHKQGQIEAAASFFEAAIADIERLRVTIQAETFLTAFLADKTDVYAALIALRLEQNDLPAAFALVENARSRTLVEMMLGSLNATSTETVENFPEIRADLNILYNQLLGDGEQRGSFAQLSEQAGRLERQLALAHKIAPDNRPGDMTLEPISGERDTDVTLVTYYALDDELLAFVTDHRQQLVRDIGRLKTVQSLVERLRIQLERFNGQRHLSDRHRAQLLRSTRQVLHQLYEATFAAVAPFVKHDKVVIVPHGVLNRVPFHALFDGDRYLLDGYEISYAPGVVAFRVCQQRPAPGSDDIAVFGVSDPNLVAVSAETSAIAAQFPASRTYLDQAATGAQFQQSAQTVQWLHIASHGLFRQDNPAFSALKLHDEWVTAQDILALNIPASLVTLSACESARSRVVGMDEAIGLPRAFLAAGASACIVSQWRVDDAISAEMMPILYKNLRAMPTATALRAAQLTMRERYPHPFYWAPFILTGKRA